MRTIEKLEKYRQALREYISYNKTHIPGNDPTSKHFSEPRVDMFGLINPAERRMAARVREQTLGK